MLEWASVDVLKAQVTFSLKDQEDLTCTKKASRGKKSCLWQEIDNVKGTHQKHL